MTDETKENTSMTTEQQMRATEPGTVFGIKGYEYLPAKQQDLYLRLDNGNLLWFIGDGSEFDGLYYEEIPIEECSYVVEDNNFDLVVIR